LESWISANPVGRGVNWACTMENALRILCWVFLFLACSRSRPWKDGTFRSRLLCSLIQHALFVERYPEESPVNGNHFTADLAGMTVAGQFFGEGRAAARWSREGWRQLQRELFLQTGEDGVDIEASSAYHRLVLELFLVPLSYRKAGGQAAPPEVRERLLRMAAFSEWSSKPNGRVPLWGDADDGRALPLGGQDFNDHRYLKYMVTNALGEAPV